MLTGLRVIILQTIQIWNHYVVHLKLIFYVEYISIFQKQHFLFENEMVERKVLYQICKSQSIMTQKKKKHTKKNKLCWWLSGKETTCQYRRHRFDP